MQQAITSADYLMLGQTLWDNGKFEHGVEHIPGEILSFVRSLAHSDDCWKNKEERARVLLPIHVKLALAEPQANRTTAYVRANIIRDFVRTNIYKDLNARGYGTFAEALMLEEQNINAHLKDRLEAARALMTTYRGAGASSAAKALSYANEALENCNKLPMHNMDAWTAGLTWLGKSGVSACRARLWSNQHEAIRVSAEELLDRWLAVPEQKPWPLCTLVPGVGVV